MSLTFFTFGRWYLPVARTGRYPWSTHYPPSVDFQIEHHLDAPPHAVAEVLLDEGFQASLEDLEGLAERRVLSQTETGGRVERRTRYVLDVHIGGPARAFLGNADPAWIEVAHWDPGTLTWEWAIEPEVAGELLDASGETVLVGDSGTARRVVGRVSVKVPLYGSRVERWIVEGLERAYEEEALRLSRWLGA